MAHSALRRGSSHPRPQPRGRFNSDSRLSFDCTVVFCEPARYLNRTRGFCDRLVHLVRKRTKQVVSVHQIDPLQDPRWPHFLAQHPSASVFHTTAWLEALRHTYGYEPFVLTTCAPGRELTNGL